MMQNRELNEYFSFLFFHISFSGLGWGIITFLVLLFNSVWDLLDFLLQPGIAKVWYI